MDAIEFTRRKVSDVGRREGDSGEEVKGTVTGDRVRQGSLPFDGDRESDRRISLMAECGSNWASWVGELIRSVTLPS